ncbi:MAG: ribonuclease HII [Coriobacteriales bacterium]
MDELSGGGVAAGLDEVGRGPLAGPLTVAAVVLPPEPQIVGLDDSKKVSPKRREELALQIMDTALAFGIAHIEPQEIDACGMAASLRACMLRALKSCGLEPDCVLIDGNPLNIHPRERSVVKGDGSVACIAAASILAKVTRDHIMEAYAQSYPEYGFESNKGYGSAAHIAAIREHGPCPLHRMSFLGKILAG